MAAATDDLPHTARDLFQAPLPKRLAYLATIAFARATGVWRHPMRAYGDLERARFIDLAYWLYKTTDPVRRARRGSGLEAYFTADERHRCELPEGFQPASDLRISAVGDLMNHPYLAASGADLYAAVEAAIFGADVAMANLECPIVEDIRKDLVIAFDEPASLVFNREEFAAARGPAGRCYDLLSTACNHSLDQGAKGAESTLRILAEEGIAQCGLNPRAEDAEQATILNRNGFRLGVVGYTFGLNARRPPPDRPWLVNRMLLNDGPRAIDFRQLERQLAYCRAAEVDFVIAQLHWGMEHEFYPLPDQVELAHELAERGVDLILGHHPHVLQPYEVYRARRDGGRCVPIYYSLGNLVNPFTAPYVCRSGIAQVTLGRSTDGDGKRRTYVQEAGLREVRQTVDRTSRTLRLEPLPPS